jgi:hypothetical protein
VKRKRPIVRVRTTAVQPTTCPACSAAIEAVTGTAKPYAGGITLCVYCRAFLVFTEDLHQRVLSNAEWLALPRDYRRLLTSLREELAESFP